MENLTNLLSFVIILHSRTHAHLTQQGRMLFTVLEYNQVTVPATQIRRGSHEKYVTSTCSHALQFAVLGNCADVPQKWIDMMRTNVGQRSMRIRFQCRPVEATQLLLRQVSWDERSLELHNWRRVLYYISGCADCKAKQLLRLRGSWNLMG